MFEKYNISECNRSLICDYISSPDKSEVGFHKLINDVGLIASSRHNLIQSCIALSKKWDCTLSVIMSSHLIDLKNAELERENNANIDRHQIFEFIKSQRIISSF